MRRAAVLIALLAACGSSGSGTPTTTTATPLTTKDGVALSADVVNRIQTATDCTALQAEFDQAAKNHDANPAGSENALRGTAYMQLADKRKQEINCP